MKIKSIAIIGLGLMGGSLAAACRKKFPQARILGITRNPQALRQALRKRWIHEGFRDIASGVSQADLVVIGTPVDVIIPTLKTIEKAARQGTLVTDMGSVKGALIRQAESLKLKKIFFIGAHPMAGSHERGIEAAHADLYDHGYTFVIRSNRGSRKAFHAVLNFWKKISPRVFVTDAEAHDRIVSDISHLPHAVAACLTLAPQSRSLAFSASGFRDATRIAQGHPDIWGPIFEFNTLALRRSLASFRKQLSRFESLLARRNYKQLKQLLEQARKKRSNFALPK